MEPYVIGADLRAEHKTYGLFTLQKKLLQTFRTESNFSLSAEAFFDGVADDIRHFLEEHHIAQKALVGLGLGLPSYLLFTDGYIIKTQGFPNLSHFAARKYLKQKLGNIEIVLDSLPHIGALAEQKHGAGKGFSHMLYHLLNFGTGIIIDSRLFRGTYGWSGESSHMIITPGEGQMCECGNRGCFHSWTSADRIVRHVRDHIEAGETTVLAEMAGGADKISISHIEKACLLGDSLALWARSTLAEYLGIWTYNLYSVFNINCFVFGGSLLYFEGLLDRVHAVFDRYHHMDFPVHFKPESQKENRHLFGAAELLSDKITFM